MKKRRFGYGNVKFFKKYLHKCGKSRTFATVQWNEGLEKASHSCFNNTKLMITKDVVKTLVEEWLQNNDYFLVDIIFGADDRIVIEIDHADGVWIEDCAELSRFLQDKLGDELGDYELEVGSAGIGQPFKVEQQYRNHIGDEVEVLGADGKKVQGILKEVSGREFVLTMKEKQTIEGKKRPVLVDIDKTYSMDDVKYAKYVLAFK